MGTEGRFEWVERMGGKEVETALYKQPCNGKERDEIVAAGWGSRAQEGLVRWGIQQHVCTLMGRIRCWREPTVTGVSE